MKILVVTNFYPTPQSPASGVFIQQQVKGLQEIGLNVEVLLIDRGKEGMNAYWGIKKKIEDQIKNVRPDLVHVMYGGVMASQVVRACGNTPVIVTFHGTDLLGEPFASPLRKVIAGYGVWSSWKAAQKASGVIVVAKALRNSLPENVDRRKIRIIPCGIEIKRFQPLDQLECCQKLGWDPEKFHVLFRVYVAGNSRVKRPELARMAVADLQRRGVDAELHFLKGIPNEEVPIWLNASNVVLLTSSHEGSPTIIKEALGCNVPVVSVDVGDVRERIEGIKGCYLASPDPHDLGAKLILVHDSGQSIDGRVALEKLSLEKVALLLNQFYEDVLMVQYKKSVA